MTQFNPPDPFSFGPGNEFQAEPDDTVDPFNIVDEPEFAQGIFEESTEGLPTFNMRQFFQGQFGDFFNKFQLQLARQFDDAFQSNQDLTFDDFVGGLPQETFGNFLSQQPFQEQFAGLPPEVAGKLTGRFSPFSTFFRR